MTKVITNSTSGIQREVKVKRQKIAFSTLEGGSNPAVLSMIEQATAALTKLKPLWRVNNISLRLKAKLMRSLVTCIYPYDCKSLTWTAELEKRTQAFELR